MLRTPAPRVLAWSSSAENDVETEYIIMGKAKGIQLITIWPELDVSQKVKVIRAIARCQRVWTSVSFPRIGNPYYASSIKPKDSHDFTYVNEDG